MAYFFAIVNVTSKETKLSKKYGNFVENFFEGLKPYNLGLKGNRRKTLKQVKRDTVPLRAMLLPSAGKPFHL
jgi:hypothetical protein